MSAFRHGASRISTMAKRNYLVEGLSGAGKSSVYEALIGRGYKAISTDRAWKYHPAPDTGLPGRPVDHANSMWDERKAVDELETRNQTCCSSVEAAVIATASCPTSPRYSTSALTMTRCGAGSESAPTTTLASSPRSSSSCSASIGATRNRLERKM